MKFKEYIKFMKCNKYITFHYYNFIYNMYKLIGNKN